MTPEDKIALLRKEAKSTVPVQGCGLVIYDEDGKPYWLVRDDVMRKIFTTYPTNGS